MVHPWHNPEMIQNNGQGAADGQMIPMFEEWLTELAGKEADSVFYAQFYNFNQRELPWQKRNRPRNQLLSHGFPSSASNRFSLPLFPKKSV